MTRQAAVQLTVSRLSLAYDRTRVIEDLSFSVSAGDYLCIVGENGTGKSTLLRGLLGLLSPESGEIRFAPDVAGAIGYLPQQTAQQRDFPASVAEVVASGCLNRRPFSGRRARARAAEWMARMEIEALADRPYGALSGGQQQRVLLARALCASDALLLLDEPTAGLDPLVAAALYREIHRLSRSGTTVVMVTHDLAPALSSATHVLHLGRGQHWFGRRDDYLASPLGRAYTGGDRT